MNTICPCALATTAAGRADAVASASSASVVCLCATAFSHDTAALWAKETTFDCYANKHRAVLYDVLSRNGATTGRTTGAWKGNDLESMASTSESLFFPGPGTQIR